MLRDRLTTLSLVASLAVTLFANSAIAQQIPASFDLPKSANPAFNFEIVIPNISAEVFKKRATEHLNNFKIANPDFLQNFQYDSSKIKAAFQQKSTEELQAIFQHSLNFVRSPSVLDNSQVHDALIKSGLKITKGFKKNNLADVQSIKIGLLPNEGVAVLQNTTHLNDRVISVNKSVLNAAQDAAVIFSWRTLHCEHQKLLAYALFKSMGTEREQNVFDIFKFASEEEPIGIINNDLLNWQLPRAYASLYVAAATLGSDADCLSDVALEASIDKCAPPKADQFKIWRNKIDSDEDLIPAKECLSGYDLASPRQIQKLGLMAYNHILAAYDDVLKRQTTFMIGHEVAHSLLGHFAVLPKASCDDRFVLELDADKFALAASVMAAVTGKQRLFELAFDGWFDYGKIQDLLAMGSKDLAFAETYEQARFPALPKLEECLLPNPQERRNYLPPTAVSGRFLIPSIPDHPLSAIYEVQYGGTFATCLRVLDYPACAIKMAIEVKNSCGKFTSNDADFDRCYTGYSKSETTLRKNFLLKYSTMTDFIMQNFNNYILQICHSKTKYTGTMPQSKLVCETGNSELY